MVPLIRTRENLLAASTPTASHSTAPHDPTWPHQSRARRPHVLRRRPSPVRSSLGWPAMGGALRGGRIWAEPFPAV